MKPYYSKKVIEHFTHPKNFGEIKNASGVGKVGNPRCGDIMKLFIKVEKKEGKEIIKDIKFHTLGCAAAIATSDMVCDLVKGKSVKDALRVDYKKVIKELGYLPEVKIHCSFLAQQGLKAAIENYEKINDKRKKK
jgi:nitrogen fixation NifU-like protein